MSTLTVSNVSDGSLSIPTTYVTNGSAKAWVNFNGQGTIAARDSLNVSSLTDNGTGDYNVNFSNAFGAADYAAIASGTEAQTRVSDAAPTASSVNVRTNSTDSPYVSCGNFGDLA
jgi:hypothetical protein